MMVRTYTELMSLPTYEERFRYLMLSGKIGEETFGRDRYLNQGFYNSNEWKNFRREIIMRDFGCDLADRDHPFAKGELVVIHHLNPITPKDILDFTDYLMTPEYVIATTDRTHRAIHYGDESYILTYELIERRPNDTCPWKN